MVLIFVPFVCVRFSSAGVQPGRAREQKGSRVEEEGRRPGQGEADL